MSYTKHDFTSGEILYASQMRDIDNAIYSLDGRVTTVEGAASNLSNLSAIRDDLDEALVVGRNRRGELNQNADLFLDPGAYVVDYDCINTPYRDERYYTYNLENDPSALGLIFVYGYRNKTMAAANLLCQVFIEGPRILTSTEELIEDMEQLRDPTYSYPIGRIFTRYYSINNGSGAWSRWYGYPNQIEIDKQLNSIRNRLEALENPSGGGGEEDKD